MLGTHMRANSVPPGPDMPKDSSGTPVILRGTGVVLSWPIGFQSDGNPKVV